MRRLAAGLVLLAAAACGPTAPKGVDQTLLDEEIADAIGDPYTCVLIAEAPSGKLVYRYGSHVTCGRTLPACVTTGDMTADRALKAAVKTGQEMTTSCPTIADGSRTFGWAAGTAGPGLAYAAAMEGERALPGRVMADRLTGVFRRTGVSAPARKAP